VPYGEAAISSPDALLFQCVLSLSALLHGVLCTYENSETGHSENNCRHLSGLLYSNSVGSQKSRHVKIELGWNSNVIHEQTTCAKAAERLTFGLVYISHCALSTVLDDLMVENWVNG
jgi:hypothetical protein